MERPLVSPAVLEVQAEGRFTPQVLSTTRCLILNTGNAQRQACRPPRMEEKMPIPLWGTGGPGFATSGRSAGGSLSRTLATECAGLKSHPVSVDLPGTIGFDEKRLIMDAGVPTPTCGRRRRIAPVPILCMLFPWIGQVNGFFPGSTVSVRPQYRYFAYMYDA